jgi:hypothetical protein
LQLFAEEGELVEEKDAQMHLFVVGGWIAEGKVSAHRIRGITTSDGYPLLLVSLEVIDG